MECTCFEGYCAADEAATLAEENSQFEFFIGWEDTISGRYILESDLPANAYDEDMDDIGIHLDGYIRGYVY